MSGIGSVRIGGFGLRVLIVVVLWLVGSLAACAPAESPSSSTTLVRVPTQPRVPDGQTPPPCPPATIEGLLVADAIAGVALEEPNGRRRSVIWPFGYALREGDTAALVNARGEVVARVGDVVELAGGEGAGGTWMVCS